jgi:hypothetical protein
MSPRRTRAAARPATFVLVALIGSGSGAALSLNFETDASAGIITTDNLFRVPAGSDSNITVLDANFLLEQRTRTLDLVADGGLIYRKYDLDGVDDDLLPYLRGSVDLAIVEDVFAWTLDTNVGQLARNATGGLVPADRERFSVIGTGPDLRIPLGDNYALYSAARYSLLEYERSPFDSTKSAVEAGLERALGSNARWRVTGLHSKTDFSDAPEDFTLDALLASLSASGRRTDVSLSVGLQRLDDTEGTDSGWLAELSVERRIGRRSFLALDASSRYASAAELLGRRQDLEADVYNTVDGVAASGAVRQDAVNISWGTEGRRSALTATAGYFNNGFRVDPDIENRSGTYVSVFGEFSLTPRFLLEAQIDSIREAPELGAPLRTDSGRLQGTWRFTRYLAVSAGTERFRRTRRADPSISETRLFVLLNFRYFDSSASVQRESRNPSRFRRQD